MCINDLYVMELLCMDKLRTIFISNVNAMYTHYLNTQMYIRM